MSQRRGMGRGRGKGYRNIIGKDPMVHSQSAKGMKQPQKVFYVDYSGKRKKETATKALEDYRKESKYEKIPISKLRAINKSKGQFWFSTGTMKFFNSKLPKDAIVKGRKAYFVSSEQYIDERADVRLPRKYTLRVMDLQTGNVDTIGNFQQYANKELAEYKLKEFINSKDSDKDGVPDKIDCDPNDPTKQDEPNISARGLEEDDTMIPEPEVPAVQKSRLSRAFSFAKEKGSKAITQFKESQKKKRLEMFKEIKHPKVRALEKQQERVNTLNTQFLNADESQYEKLRNELEEEQDQLRQLQEDVTAIKVEDLSDKELRTLAVRANEGFSLFGSGNEYEDELVRRIKKRKELNKRLAEAKKEPVDTGFF